LCGIDIFPPDGWNAPSRNIVFVKFIEQGALVLHQKTFKEAARKYGADNIYLCTFASNAQLVDVMHIVPPQNRIYISENSFFQFASGFLSAIISLRSAKVDTAIDLEFFSCASAIFCYLSGADKRVGYHRYMGSQNYRGDLFTHRLHYSHYVHVAESSWSMLMSLESPIKNLPALDIEAIDLSVSPEFTPTATDADSLSLLLGSAATGRDIIIMNPSLNDTLPLRRWPAYNFEKFISAFDTRFPSCIFVLTGRTDEYELTQQFISTFPADITAINLCGKTTLRDILTLYSNAKLLLTSDSGPGHFAALTYIHSIVLFGPETPQLYGPLSPRSKVFYKALPCSPCYNVYNNRQSSCANNLCMKKISVQEVMQAAEEIMQQQSVK
jgi:ADP-heptose:LPS heptosyltransferase